MLAANPCVAPRGICTRGSGTRDRGIARWRPSRAQRSSREFHPFIGRKARWSAECRLPTAPLTVSGGVETSPLESMSVKELKVIAAGLGVSTKGCVEKRDIVERIKARGIPRQAKAKTATKMFNKMFGQ